VSLVIKRRFHVWPWDFLIDRTRDGQALKLMLVIDELT
jgi:hypothetical protein